MKIITYANQKGGSGKTTGVQLAANILSAAPFNKKILVLDLDPQLSTYKSSKESLRQNPTNPHYDILAITLQDANILIQNLHKMFCFDEFVGENGLTGLNTKIERKVSLPGKVDIIAENQILYLFKNNLSYLDAYDLILIDLPGTLVSNQEIAGPLLLSDMVVVPFKATDKDVASTLTFMDVIYALKKVRKSKGLDQIIFTYINEHKLTTDYRKVKKLLDHFKNNGVHTSNVNLSNRKVYATIDTVGKSIFQTAINAIATKNINQNLEIKNFTKELINLLAELENLTGTVDLSLTSKII